MVYVLSDEDKSDIFEVAKKLGYATKWQDIHNPYLFLQALTQRSYSNEHHNVENNEVLAFYGDRVLEWYVTKMLMDRFSGEGEETPWLLSDFDEAEYTDLKSKLVCRSNLANIARYYDLGDYLRVGRGSKKSETNSDNVLGELMEALIGACAIDSSNSQRKGQIPTSLFSVEQLLSGGVIFPANQMSVKNDSVKNDNVEKIISQLLNIEQFLDEEENKEYIQNDSIIKEQDFENPKGALNKLYTKGMISEPVYEIVDQSEDDDNRHLWKCSCTVEGFTTQKCDGYYYRRNYAEADAAKKVLMEILKVNPGL